MFCGGQSKGLDVARGGDWKPGFCRISNMGGMGSQLYSQDCFACAVGDDWRRERKTRRPVRRLLPKWGRNHLEGEFKMEQVWNI